MAQSPGFIHGHGAAAYQFPSVLGQTTSAASLSVVIASDYTLPVTISNTAATPLYTRLSNGTTAYDTITSAQAPATLGQKAMSASLAVVLASDQSAIPASQSGTWTITGIGGTVSLPTGASTSALQTTGNTSLSSIDGKLGGRAKVLLYRNDYSSVNVTTSAYVQITASTSAAISRLRIFDSSGSAMIIATGAAASEVDQLYIPPGGSDTPFELSVASGTRLSIKALDASATVGQIIITALS